jgi:hypothetical protein
MFGGSGPASAITGGTFDGESHPFVGLLDDGHGACSGVLLSPQVLIGAAHCLGQVESAFGNNNLTGAPIVEATFDPLGFNNPSAQFFRGSYYPDPDWCLLCRGGRAGGLPGFDTHDIAVVIFNDEGCDSCSAIPDTVTGGHFAELPTVDEASALPMGAPITIVGYGVQNFIRGGGPCSGPCVPRFGNLFTREVAQTTLVQSEDRIADMFLKLHANSGGTCDGDSGGPDLVDGSNVVVGLTTFEQSSCAGVTYSYRVDRSDSLNFIRTTAADHGAALSNTG